MYDWEKAIPKNILKKVKKEDLMTVIINSKDEHIKHKSKQINIKVILGFRSPLFYAVYSKLLLLLLNGFFF